MRLRILRKSVILFFILIDTISYQNTDLLMGIFVDDKRVICQIWSEIDASNLQSDLELLYDWAQTNNMMFNGEMFECLKSGENYELKTQYNYSTPEFSNPIEDLSSLRDLGVMFTVISRLGYYIYKIV